LVVTICSRACEKTNQQRFQRFQEKRYELVSETFKFEERKRSALKGFAEKHAINVTNQTFDPKTFLMVVKQRALEKFQSQTKVRLVLKASMEKVSPTYGSLIVFRISNPRKRLSWNPPAWMNSGLK